ncbi:MAG: SGNH/GDSL hydrolase family protein [Chitinophagaceae bacterium]
MKLLLALLIMLTGFAALSQSRLQVVADTVRVADAELVIRNNSRSANGYLYNTGNGITKFVQLGKSFQFNVGGDPSYPKNGDSSFTHPDLVSRNIKVWRNGIFQYRGTSQGIRVDSVAGTIVFYPALVSNDKIYIEGLYNVALVVNLAEDTSAFHTNLEKLATGISTSGNNFTLRWATNNSTLSASPRVVGIGSSTLAGLGLSAPNRLGDKIEAWLNTNTTSPAWVNLAVSGYSSSNLLPAGMGGNSGTNIETALSSNPDFIFVSLPSNDAALGYTVNQSLVNYRLLDKLASDRGIPIFFETTQPRTQLNSDGQLLLKQLADSIRAIWPKRFVEGFYDIVDNSASTAAVILPQYAQSDGIHLNSDGNQLVANRLFSRWLGYFQAITGVQEYIIEKSTDSLTWTSFDVVANANLVKKTYERTNNDSAYFRVKAKYTNNTSSPYSNVSFLPKASSGGGDTTALGNTRILIDLGGDGVTTINGSNAVDGRPMPAPDSLGKYWNNWTGTGNLGFRDGAQKLGLVTTTNEETVMSIKLIGDPYGTFFASAPTRGMNFNGFTVGVEDYPQQALYDNLFLHNSSTGSKLRLKGLQPGATYRIKIWGARIDGGAVRTVETKLGSEAWTSSKTFNSRYLTTEGPEYDRAIVYTNITGLDSLDIDMRVLSGNTFGHISLIDIHVDDYLPVLTTGVNYNDTSMNLSSSSIQLAGSVNVPGLTVSRYDWGQSSGPGTAIISDGNTAQPTISGLTNGVFDFKVVVTFTNGQQAVDNVKLTVFPDNEGKKTMRVHFSAAAATPIPGWTNAYGAITTSVRSATDAVTGWGVNSVAANSTYWAPLGGTNSQDNLGQTTGNNSGIVPDIALNNYWYNNNRKFNGSNYNVEITGLDPAKTYTIKLVGSRNTSGAAPRYSDFRVNTTDTSAHLLNAHGNTSQQTVVTGIAPDANGKIKIGVFTPNDTTTYGVYAYLNAMIVQEEN